MTTTFAPMSLAAILLPIHGPGLTDAHPGRFTGECSAVCVCVCVCVCVGERERKHGCVGAQLEAWSLGLGAIPLATKQAYRGEGTVTHFRKKDDAATGRIHDRDAR
ncbi:uncharacterized protein LY79DRAFT_558919 [Colletotrichum navitas]|uniref:Secreted protein n=1 Tax=Colletotrichum navitas TaxID=681940 RepID=A0AAD8PW84_9PEZI|nr:uncharacterized protein LY79DRAFT_558919 [Colletotrichum navitas]KAK1585358.1 hypothetical protein LY79DRAFT_558919 [Colletotrichum navitas]